jgi:hypothetical protein
MLVVTCTGWPCGPGRARLADVLQDALGNGQRVVVARARQQHAKLLATEAAHGVVRTQQQLHRLCKRDQHTVAFKVPQAVVDLLEVVQIQHQQDQRLVLGAGVRKGGFGALQEHAAVDHARQRVGAGHAVQLAFQVLALGDVAINALDTSEVPVLVEDRLAADGDVDHAPVLAHHLAGKVGHGAMRLDGGLERVAVRALRVVGLGRAADDFLRLVAQHAAHTGAYVQHHTLGVGAVVHVLHVLEQAPEMLLALAQLGLDLALVRHVGAADQHRGQAVHLGRHACEQCHAQLAPAGADANFGGLVGNAAVGCAGHLLDAAAGALLVHGVHKLGGWVAHHLFHRIGLEKHLACRVDVLDHAIAHHQHGDGQHVPQAGCV